MPAPVRLTITYAKEPPNAPTGHRETHANPSPHPPTQHLRMCAGFRAPRCVRAAPCLTSRRCFARDPAAFCGMPRTSAQPATRHLTSRGTARFTHVPAASMPAPRRPHPVPTRQSHPNSTCSRLLSAVFPAVPSLSARPLGVAPSGGVPSGGLGPPLVAWTPPPRSRRFLSLLSVPLCPLCSLWFILPLCVLSASSAFSAVPLFFLLRPPFLPSSL